MMPENFAEKDVFDSPADLIEFNKSWQARVQAERNTADENLKTFKKALKDNGITSFKVSYSGSGDSGEIYETEIKPNDITIPDCEWVELDYKTLKREKFFGIRDAEDYIEEFCYSLLEAYHGGWEINEGQNGDLEWDSESDEISHNYFVLIEEGHTEEF